MLLMLEQNKSCGVDVDTKQKMMPKQNKSHVIDVA